MNQPVLKMVDICKDYYGNKVLKGVNIEVKKGQIHALLGENGAGKSTLMNILFGMPVIHSTGGYDGEIYIDGEKVNITSPNDALKHGIGMVHQEFMIIPGFTIAENIKLNREPLKPNLASKLLGKNLQSLDTVKMKKDSRAALDKLGVDISEDTPVQGLPVGYMQFVEIAREIDKSNVKLLVFDEPTAVLTESEADLLLDAMKKLSDLGVAILFITHRLDEVISVCDHLTILRDGGQVATMPTESTNIIKIAEMMVGREVEKIDRKINAHEHAKTAMKIENLTVRMPGEVVRGIDLDIRQGEILGIGGLAGQGKIGIANGIMGIYPAKGRVSFEDKEVQLGSPTKAINSGLAFVSEDRRGVGLLLDMSIEMNMVVPAIQNQNKFMKRYFFISQRDNRSIRNNANRFIQDLDIRCVGAAQSVRRLSGGNQQKVCIARALTLEPKLLFVSEPTRGIDIGAKKLVLETLIKLNEEGMTVVITSSELGELRSVCDRIAIITEGKLAGVLPSDSPDADFGVLMSGVKLKGGES